MIKFNKKNMNKKKLYESIMESVSKELQNIL